MILLRHSSAARVDKKVIREKKENADRFILEMHCTLSYYTYIVHISTQPLLYHTDRGLFDFLCGVVVYSIDTTQVR